MTDCKIQNSCTSSVPCYPTMYGSLSSHGLQFSSNTPFCCIVFPDISRMLHFQFHMKFHMTDKLVPYCTVTALYTAEVAVVQFLSSSYVFTLKQECSYSEVIEAWLLQENSLDCRNSTAYLIEEVHQVCYKVTFRGYFGKTRSFVDWQPTFSKLCWCYWSTYGAGNLITGCCCVTGSIHFPSRGVFQDG